MDIKLVENTEKERKKTPIVTITNKDFGEINDRQDKAERGDHNNNNNTIQKSCDKFFSMLPHLQNL